MHSFVRVLLPVAAALTLAACETERLPEPADVATQGIAPAIKVTTEQQRHVVYVTPGSGKISDAERSSLAAFVSDAAIGDPEAVHIRLRGAVTPAQLSAVTQTVVSAGVQPAKIEFEAVPPSDLGMSGGPVTGEAVEVVASVSHVDYPHCPRNSWTSISGVDNPSSSNFGCSTTNNLEAMVADPRDLVQGESGGKTDNAVAGTAIQRLQTDHVKPLPQTQTTTAVQQTGGGQQ